MPHNAVLVCLVLICFLVAPAIAQSQRPNFLFIYTDDQRYDAMGCVQREQGADGRFPWLKTPNMDRLAASGVRFRNAFVTSSLCAPSRASFLSGQYNHANRVANNHTNFPLDNVTSSALLAKAGYDTAYFGKWHHQQQKERPGFKYVASYLGQGVYEDCPFNVNGTMTPTRGRIDDVTTDFAIEYLKGRDKNRPFDIVVGYKAPHDPRTPADQDKGLYRGEGLRPVPNLGTRAVFLPPRAAASRESEKSPEEYRLDYFRCITSTDRTLGRLLDALDSLGLAENTVVIFASDNGYYMGEHGLNDKRSAYEESMRIPFIVRYPKLAKKGAAVDAMVLNIDLAPTLLDFAGVEIPKEMHGRSFKSLLAGEHAEWREGFLYEYFHETGYASPATLAVRTEAAKLIKYPGHDEWTELFNLAHDPYETQNLYNDPAARDLLVRMDREMARQSEAVDFKVPETADQPDPTKPGHF